MKIVENIKKIGSKELSNLIFASPKVRRLLLPVADKKIKAAFVEMMNNSHEIPAEVEGQYWFVRNLLMRGSERMDENLLSPDIMETIFNSFVDNVLFKGTAIKDKGYAEEGVERPTLLVISPTKRCNLQCTGCYAGSNKKTAASLDWDTFDRILTEKEELWGSYFTTISGGEPFMWSDNGKTIYDMFAKHKNQYFMVYTNGTLLNPSPYQADQSPLMGVVHTFFEQRVPHPQSVVALSVRIERDHWNVRRRVKRFGCESDDMGLVVDDPEHQLVPGDVPGLWDQRFDGHLHVPKWITGAHVQDDHGLAHLHE